MSGYKTRSAKPFLATPYEYPERQFRANKNNTPISIHNLFSFCEHSDSDTESHDDTSINTLTMEQYMERNNDYYSRRTTSEPEITKVDIKGQKLSRSCKINSFLEMMIMKMLKSMLKKFRIL